MTQLWAQELAASFWRDAGESAGDFPRDLRRAVALALPLAVVDVPRPRVVSVNRWLDRYGIHPIDADAARPLRACLLVGRGAGVVFLDGADADDERQFSLGHEVAHYLIECQSPRSLIARRLGPGSADLLDGTRLPTIQERVGAALAGVSFDRVMHLMVRGDHGALSEAVTRAERHADLLAIELLAPVEAVTSLVDMNAGRVTVEHALKSRFGLPEVVAGAYAELLAPQPEVSPLVRRLRAVSHFSPRVGNEL